MEVFIWTVVVYLALEISATLVCLGLSIKPTRTIGSMIISVFLGIGFLIWAVIILASKT